MTVFLPSKERKKYRASDAGSDLFGNLIRSRNLDFNKRGYLSLARKPFVLMTETQDANFEAPLAITTDDNDAFVVTNDSMFRIGIDGGDFSIGQESAGTPPSFGFQSDGCFFNGLFVASGTTMVCSWTPSTWTSRITGLSSSFPHPLCVSEHQQYLAVANGAEVRLYNTAWSLVVTCTIPTGHVVTWIRWKGNLIYFGTRNVQGGQARMYIWNGSGTAAQAGYGYGAVDWFFSGCEYGSTIAVVTSTGQLLQFAGDGFTQIMTDDGMEMNFPVFYTQVPWGSSAAVSNLRGKVTSRGMEAKGRKLYIVVNSEIDFDAGGVPSYLPYFPGGLWVADPEVGLYHKAGFDHAQRVKIAASALSSDTLTVGTAQIFETGDPIYCTAVGSLTGDIDGDCIYYAIKVSSTQFKLALTPMQALAGTNITITGAVTSSEFLFNQYESVGATEAGGAGPVCILSSLGMPRFNGLEVLYGADVVNATGTTIGCIMSLGMGKNVGSFITPKIQASAVTDIFKKLIAKFPPLNISTRKIVVKYRMANRWGLPGRLNVLGGSAVWLTSTTFTINPKTYDMAAAAVGDEIEFTRGSASGYTAHISLITVNSATDWTITIDEAMPDVVASDTSRFFIDNWTKYKTISTTDDAKAAAKGLKNMALGKNGKWVQLKIELRGYTDIEETMDMEEVMLLNTADQKYA